MDERKASRSTNVARNQRVSTGSSSSSNALRGKNGGAVLFLLKSPRAHALLSAFPPRAMSTMRDRQIHDGPQPISLEVQRTNPGLACPPDKVQVEVLGSGKRVEPLV